ncbi:MAG TPA: hypothetical protein VHQ87_06275, partial [Rhizobacter sp.]|nr:hypothetical protein [Rhizobacter sp.]
MAIAMIPLSKTFQVLRIPKSPSVELGRSLVSGGGFVFGQMADVCAGLQKSSHLGRPMPATRGSSHAPRIPAPAL